MLTIKPLPFLCLSLLCWLLCTSFSVVPPPAERASVQEQRQRRHIHRLERRLQRARTSAQKQRIQRRLDHLRQAKNQDQPVNKTLSIVSFGLGVAATFCFAIVTVLIALGPLMLGVYGLLIFSILLVLAAITCAITALRLNDHQPERFGGKTWATLGLILGLVPVVVILIIYLWAAIARGL